MAISFSYPPRLECAALPTPIERLARLSDALGGHVEIWIKRDDLTGFALSGNKVRKLEFAFAHALARGVSGFVTCGGYDSNHCRATAFLAARLGLTADLFLRTEDGEPTADALGNTLLDQLVGARIHWISRAEYARRDELMRELADESAQRGDSIAVVPEGASNGVGSLGYIRAAEELEGQRKEKGLDFAAVVHAVGSGGTTAGLSAGRELFAAPWQVVGVPVCDDGGYFRQRLEEIRQELVAFDVPELTGDGGVDFVEGCQGRGYGLTTPAELRILAAISRLEGVLLDPCYTGKAFIGLLRAVQQGRFPAGSRVLFLHTGGGFSNYTFASEWRSVLAESPDESPTDLLQLLASASGS